MQHARSIPIRMTQDFVPSNTYSVPTYPHTHTHSAAPTHVHGHSTIPVTTNVSSTTRLQPALWSVGDVLRWLADLGLAQYEYAFSSRQINGRALLALKPEDLKDWVGIPRLEDRKVLAAAIRQLQGGDHLDATDLNATGGTSPRIPIGRIPTTTTTHANTVPRTGYTTYSSYSEPSFSTPSTQFNRSPVHAHTYQNVPVTTTTRIVETPSVMGVMVQMDSIDAQLNGLEVQSQQLTFIPPPGKLLMAKQLISLLDNVTKQLQAVNCGVLESPLRETAHKRQRDLVQRVSHLVTSLNRIAQEGSPTAPSYTTPFPTGTTTTVHSTTPPPSFSHASQPPASTSAEDDDEYRRPLQPKFSMRSTRVLETLDSLRNELQEIENELVGLQPTAANRAEISRLYTLVDGLLGARIDAVTVAELQSGRDVARAERKEIVKHAQQLSDRLHELKRESTLATDIPSVAIPVTVSHSPAPTVEKTGVTIPVKGRDDDESSSLDEAPLQMAKRYSVKSLDVLTAIDSYAEQIEKLERRVHQPDAGADATTIAQQAALIVSKLDSINPQQCNSGKAEARYERRDLIKRAEAIIHKMQPYVDQQLESITEQHVEPISISIPNISETETVSVSEGSPVSTPNLSTPGTDLSAKKVTFRVNEPESPVPNQTLHRTHSINSARALETLDTIKAELMDLEVEVHKLTATPDMRDEISRIFGVVDKLLATRIDAVMTNDLISGKDEAKTERKELVTRAAALLDKLQHIQAAIVA